jgi:hypothetical protein
VNVMANAYVDNGCFKSNTIQISKEIQNIQKQFPAKIKQILANVSASQLRRIRLRTEKGKSVSGSPFTPYSTKPFFSILIQKDNQDISSLKVVTENLEVVREEAQNQI